MHDNQFCCVFRKMFSLGKQVKRQRLAVAETSRLQPDKQRVSLLFSAEEAAKLDRETVFGIGINGFEELVQLDRRFADFGDFLFAEKNISFERSVETREVNDHLDRQLKLFLLRLSPYFQLKSSQKALEWLIYRYHIHEYNVSEVLRCSIPYYDTHLFARLLQILVIPDSDPLWFWLIAAQKSGWSISHLTVSEQANVDPNFFNFLRNTVKELKLAGLEPSKFPIWDSFLAIVSTSCHTEMADLPEEVLEKIFGLLDMTTRVQMLTVNRRWHQLMPFADRGCLNIARLPFDRSDSAAAITSALKAILPQIGPRVKSVKFGNVKLAADHLDLIAQFCPDLSGLNLKRATTVSEPNDFNFAAIQQMPKLKSLRLSVFGPGIYFQRWSQVDQASFLQNLSDLVGRLEEFHFSYLPFRPAFATRNLTHLRIDSDRSFTDDQLVTICTDSPNLTSLRIESCRNLHNFRPIGRLSKLTELTLSSSSVDLGQMEVIVRNCTELSRIGVYGDDQILRFRWLRHLPNLKCLSTYLTRRMLADIPHNWGIEELKIFSSHSDALLLELSDKSPRLKRLRLYSGDLTDDVVVQLAGRWALLEELHLSHDKGISDESIVQLSQRESLRLLDLHWRENFNVDIFRPLLTKRQQLQVVTPLNIRVQCDIHRRYFDFRLFNQANEELRQVKVCLVPYFCD